MPDIESLKKDYYDFINNELPHLLLPGIQAAMDVYAGKFYDEDEFQEICINVDTEISSLVFSLGDGFDIDNADDDAVFYTFKCDELSKYEAVCREARLNAVSEVGEWLGDAIALAADEGVFLKLGDIAIYGDYLYTGEYDVFYEQSAEDDDDDWDENDWDDE